MRTPLCRPTAPNAPAGPSLLTGRVWAMGLMVTSAVWGCGEGTGPNGNGGGNEVTWQVSVLGYAPQPFRLLVRNGSLYWQDVSLDIPLNRLSLADGAYTPYPTVPNPENAVSDGQNLYWVSAGRLYRSSLDGTTTTVLDEGTREFTTAALMMDDSNVYWVNSVASPTCSPACTFTIRQVPKPGGPVRTLATTSQPVVALAIAAGYLFWAEVGTGPVDPDGSSGSAIKKVPLAGGTVTLLVDGLLNGLITHPGPGYHPASWHPGGGIVSDGASVYFADADFVDSYRVMRVSVDGGAVLVLADVTTGDASSVVHDLELDNGTLYWVDGNSVRSLPKAGGSVAQLAGGLVSPTNLTLTGGGRCSGSSPPVVLTGKRAPSSGCPPAVARRSP